MDSVEIDAEGLHKVAAGVKAPEEAIQDAEA
jgi:hypothetical protein